MIFDSGVGGLSIYQEVIRQSPQNDYIYVCDNQAFPYGTKQETQLIERVTQLVDRIVEHYAPDVLVVACNTASTVVLPILRSQYEFDIVGVVPAIKPAAQLTQTQHIGLLATPATIERPYTRDLIKQFASECDLTRVGSSELVHIAEDKLHGRSVNLQRTESIIRPFIDAQNIDVVVLACTHFPLINNEIDEILKKHSINIRLVDSCAGIAKRVAQLSHNAVDDAVQTPTAVFTQSIDQPDFLDLLDKLGFQQITLLKV